MATCTTTTKCWGPVCAVAVFLLGCSGNGKGTNSGFNTSGTGDTVSGGSGGSESGEGFADSAAGGSSGSPTSVAGSGSDSDTTLDAGSTPPLDLDAGSTGPSVTPDSGGSNDGSTPSTSVNCPTPPSSASANALQAWKVLNQTRVAAGSGCMNLVADLDTSAQAYCNYEASNASNMMCIAQAHVEVAGCTGFTGADVQSREMDAGYPAALAYSEVATTFGNNPTAAVPSWINTVFHRIPILDPWTVDMGYGGATGCDAIDIGRGTSTVPTNTIVVYPYDGQTDVPPAFSGLEGPAPPAPAGGFPSSYLINIYAQGLSVTTHVLTKDGDSTPLAHLWLDKNSSDLQAGLQGYFYDTGFLYGAPFASNTKYHVQIGGTYSGGTLNKSWSFTTGSQPPVN
jgi:uncharacterized protein YkwD